MSKETVVTTEIERARRDWMNEHLQSYLQSGGARGHIVDLRTDRRPRFYDDAAAAHEGPQERADSDHTSDLRQHRR